MWIKKIRKFNTKEGAGAEAKVFEAGALFRNSSGSTKMMWFRLNQNDAAPAKPKWYSLRLSQNDTVLAMQHDYH
jgi:hypothetical protein